MKTIQDIDTMIQEYVTTGNPEAEFARVTLEFFPGCTLDVTRDWENEDGVGFHIELEFCGISESDTHYPNASNGEKIITLNDDLGFIAKELFEKIKDMGSYATRNHIKSILCL